MFNRLIAWMKGDTPGVRLPWRMFWVGLIVRVLYITLAHTYRVRIFQDHFQFGWEMGRIGRALASGRGYADPFMGLSGPTAWCPPIYPLLLAGVFKLFGIYTNLSAWVIFSINSFFSAFTAIAIYQISCRSFDQKVALWAGWLWALYPAAMQYAVHWVWEMAVTACIFSWLIVVALRLRDIGEPVPVSNRKRTALWAIFGLLWGVIALLNPSLLTFLPAAGLWILWGERDHLVRGVANALLATLICTVCFVPWVWRNQVVFHAFIPTRPNLGCELYASSLEANNGFPWGAAVSVFPDTPDMKRYRAMGEVAFCKERGELGKAIFKAHPGRFSRFTRKRIYFYWIGVPHPIENSFLNEAFRELNYCFLSFSGLGGLGLALYRRKPGAILYAGAFFFLPIVYYLVTVQARFRSPLEPLICILGVYLFQSADRTRTWSWQPVKSIAHV